jgi:iron complex outermembrane receptor protein
MISSKLKLSSSLVTILVAATFPATSAFAQAGPAPSDDLGEIIVTAQKREQNIQDVGIAITALGNDQLKRAGIMDSDTLAAMVPNLQITNFGSQGIAIFTIRGVNQNDFSDQNEAPNAMYVDGAYRSFIGAAGFTMFDVERVEVLRGPQGTLFGRNATGGLIHIINKKPTRHFEGEGELQVGENNMVEFRGAVSGPLSSSVQARLSVATKHNDGYIVNRLGGKQGGSENYAARFQLQIAPEDSPSSLLISGHYSKDDVEAATVYASKRAIIDPSDPARRIIRPADNAAYVAFCNAQFGQPTLPALVISTTSNCAGWEDPKPNDPYVTELDNPGISNRDLYGVTVTGNLALSDSVDLVSITDYLKLKRKVGVDTDGTGFRMFNFFSDANSDQMSQELRLQGGGSALQWVAGLYYLNIDHRIQTGIDALPDANTLAKANPATIFPFFTDNTVRQKTESYAAFGQVEAKLNSQFSVIVGGRWSHDKKEIEINTSCTNGFLPFACGIVAPPGSVQGDGFTSANSGGLNRQSKGDWTGKAELDFRPTDDVMLYASVTRGQKSGGFNASAIAGISAAITPYRPEVLTNYEIGFKSTIFGGTTRFNASAFHYDYKDYQAYTLTGLTPTIFNTDARVNGVEVELTSNPVKGLTISGSAAYLDAIAHDVRSNLLGSGVNLGDQRMPQSPKWSGTGLIRYGFDVGDGELSFQADARYNSKRYFNTVNHPALADNQDFVVNGRIAYRLGDGDWEFAIWGKNLTNATVYASGFDLSGTNGSTPLVLGPPRWFGGSVSFRFR